MNIKIEKTSNSDFKEIYDLIKESFSSAEHSDGNESELVKDLKDSSSFIPELSLIARDENKIVGYILFTKAKVKDEDVLVLAPLAVLPKYQNKKIGSTLINKGHEIAKSLGYNYSFVLGSEYYYPKFSYIPASKYNINLPKGFIDINFMISKLNPLANKISGDLIYPKEFNI